MVMAMNKANNKQQEILIRAFVHIGKSERFELTHIMNIYIINPMLWGSIKFNSLSLHYGVNLYLLVFVGRVNQ